MVLISNSVSLIWRHQWNGRRDLAKYRGITRVNIQQMSTAQFVSNAWQLQLATAHQRKCPVPWDYKMWHRNMCSKNVLKWMQNTLKYRVFSLSLQWCQMSAMASRIVDNSSVCSTARLALKHIKHWTPFFMRVIHWWEGCHLEMLCDESIHVSDRCLEICSVSNGITVTKFPSNLNCETDVREMDPWVCVKQGLVSISYKSSYYTTSKRRNWYFKSIYRFDI